MCSLQSYDPKWHIKKTTSQLLPLVQQLLRYIIWYSYTIPVNAFTNVAFLYQKNDKPLLLMYERVQSSVFWLKPDETQNDTLVILIMLMFFVGVAVGIENRYENKSEL